MVRLCDLALTLPPFVPGRDRPVRFEPDGTIVYEKGKDDWEPPREIEGYLRDSENQWRFTPLWPPCIFQSGVAMRLAACGCVAIQMRCLRRCGPIKCQDCIDCTVREAEEEEEK